MPTVIAPVDGYTGTVGRVRFLDGAGYTDDLNALRYFMRAGYAITDDTEPPAPAPVPAEPQPTTGSASPEPSAQSPDSSLYLAQLPSSHPSQHDEPGKPSPTASKAEWYEYLDAHHPGHGLTLAHTKRDMIEYAG